MKKLFLIFVLLFAASDLSAQINKSNYERSPIQLEDGDKLAIVMVHFGSSNDKSRQSYEQINNIVAEKFEDADHFEAYTSRIVISHLRKKGIDKMTPLEMFHSLKERGYTHLVVQSSHLVDGQEMESLREDLKAVKDLFKVTRLGNPLLYSVADYKWIAHAMVETISSSSDAVVLVGHGSNTPITSSYSMMDYILQFEGYKNWHVSTIEGYPTIEELMVKLEQDGAKSVTLVPFMYIAGVHAKEDIAGEWYELLTGKGYKVEMLMEGIGENPRIQDLIVNHLNFAIRYQYIDIMAKKRKYARENQ